MFAGQPRRNKRETVTLGQAFNQEARIKTQIVEFPFEIMLRRKDVIAVGIISAWSFRKAIQDHRLSPRRLINRKYARYRRDEVIHAFGLVPCNSTGKPMSPFQSTHVKIGKRRDACIR